MDKLELKHLAPYLPYGLKYHSMGQEEKQEYIDIKPKPSEFEMVGLSGLWIYSNCDYDSFIEDCFPILRPLSDLTKEIEHNGEKFILIVELAKLSYPKNSLEGLNVVKNYIEIGYGYSLHYVVKDKSFECRRGFNGRTWDYQCYVPNQLELFNKLFEWHFNVFDLPEHLWVDINTLDK